jgi:hypothetical protein
MTAKIVRNAVLGTRSKPLLLGKKQMPLQEIWVLLIAHSSVV